MSQALYRLGRLAARRPWRVIGTWVVLSILVISASSAFGEELSDSMEVPGLDSQAAVDLLTAAQSESAGLTAQVVMTPLDSAATFFDSAEAQAGLAEIQERAASLPNVLATSDPLAALTDGRDVASAGGEISPDGRVAVLRIQYPVVEQLSLADLDNLKDFGTEVAIGSPLQVELSGELFFQFEEGETQAGEMIGLVVAAVILLVAFGSFIAMGLPIGIAIFGIVLGTSSMALLTHLIDIPSFAPQMGSMIGLGVGIDYALFLVTRHREHLARGMTVEESVGRAVATAGQAVVFAGGTVVIAILGMAVAGIPFMTAGGVATAAIVLIMVIASITLLPAFLGLAGHRMKRLRQRKQRRRGGRGRASGWQRWGEHVSKHAAAYAVGVIAVLLALTAPVLALRLGLPDDGTLPESRTERRAYDLVADGFGPGINGPLVIAIDVAEDQSVVAPIAAAVAADAGVAAVAPPQVDTEAGVATSG